MKKIAGIGETLVYDEPVDITNRSFLISKAAELCKGKINTVVFRGVDRHYTFVHKPSARRAARRGRVRRGPAMAGLAGV